MAEVKIQVSAEDNNSAAVFSTVEKNGTSAFNSISTSAGAATASTTAAFDTLKIKTTAGMEAQKASINGAYESIKNSATSTADEIVRAEQAKNKAIKQINDENFAAQGVSLESLKSHWIEVTAGMVVAYEAVDKAFKYYETGAKAMQTEDTFKQVMAANGVEADKFLEKMKEVSVGTIEESDLMQRSLRGMQQGLSSDQIVKLLEVARYSARIAGTDIASAFDMIVNAAANQQTKGLKTLGLVIDQNKAFEEQAKSIGVAKDALNEQQQSQAIANAAIAEGQRQMKALNIEANNVEGIDRAKAGIKELGEMLGKQLVRDINTAFKRWDEFKQFISGGGTSASKAALQRANAEYDLAYAGLTHESTVDKNVSPISDEAIKAQDEWNQKITLSNSSLQAETKEIMALQEAADKLREKFGMQPWISAGLDQGIQFIQQKSLNEQKKAFEDLMMDLNIARQTGINKDLAEVDKWLYTEAVKFKGNEDAVTALLELAEIKRLDIRKKHAMEETKLLEEKATTKLELEKKTDEEQITYLKGYRDQLIQTYDTATAKANEYYTLAKSIGETIATETARLNGLTAPSVLPKDQMEQSAKTLKDMADAAKDPAGLQGAATSIGQWIDKYKSLSNTFGGWGVFQNMVAEQKDVLDRLGHMRSAIEQAGDAWQAYADNAKMQIWNVDMQIYDLQQRIVGLDHQLGQIRELKIDNSMALDAIQQVADKINAIMGLQAAASDAGSPAGSYSNSGITWSDTFSDPGPAYVPEDALPGAAVGTNYVKKTGLAVIHQGEEIKPAKYAGGNSGSSSITFSPSITIQAAPGSDGAQLARQIDAALADMWTRDTSKLKAKVLKK